MMWPQFQTIAQIAAGRLLNSLPEGLLIAGFAWLMLKLLPRQNSGTRFAVWFAALLAVAGLSVAGVHFTRGVASGQAAWVGAGRPPLITLPGPWGLLLFLVWALAVCSALLRLTTGLWRLRSLRRSCLPIDPAELAPSVQKTVADFTSSRRVILATSEKVSVPSALGFFAPMIVIPAWALRELSPEELNVILLHELAHLRRWDDWTNLLQKVLRAVFVFHPAVWWIESRMSLEREMACDDAVLAETANPRGYAECLIGLLEKSFARRGWAMAQAAVHRASEASLRLAQILDANRTNSKHVWKPALGLVSAFSLVCLMAVPRAPRLVAFEGNTRAVASDPAHAAMFSRPESTVSSVIPPALRARTSQAIKKQSRPAARPVVAQAIEHQAGDGPLGHAGDAPQVITARASQDNELSSADPPIANADENETEPTLLVVRTAQRVGQNSWVWSVTVWRITWTNPSRDAARAPVARKT